MDAVRRRVEGAKVRHWPELVDFANLTPTGQMDAR